MLCENCGKKEANVHYTENINGKRKEMNLCQECSQKLGIGQMDLTMPIDFSNFFGEFMEGLGRTDIKPLLNNIKTLQCNSCGYTFDDIVNTGKLGCGDCYDVFEEELDPIIRKIQGSNQHVGRMGKIIDEKVDQKQKEKNSSKEGIDQEKKIEKSKKEELEEQLKQAIKEERYEEAAKIRDEIKKMS